MGRHKLPIQREFRRMTIDFDPLVFDAMDEYAVKYHWKKKELIQTAIKHFIGELK